MTEDCKVIACPVPKNPVQDFSNQYTLDAGVVGNEPISVVINGVTIFIPPGTITVPFPPDAPTSLTIQSCSGPITLPVPLGSTPQQVQQIAQNLANLAAQAQAQCNAVAPAFPVAATFLNEQQSFDSGCTADEPLTITVALPNGVTQSGNSLVCKAGLFASSISQADANSQALSFLTALVATLFANAQATCGVPGCAISDTSNLTQTLAPFNLPAKGTLATADVSVPNSALFTINDGGSPPKPQYAIIQPSYDKTYAIFIVTAIPDGNTITIQALDNSDSPEMADGTVVGTGAKIWQILDHTEIVNPPANTNARVVGYVTLSGQFHDCTADCATGVGLTDWDGTMPFFFNNPTTVSYGQGTHEGGTDQNVNGSWVKDIFASNQGSDFVFPSWQFLVVCGAGTTSGLINAYKWGGDVADGVYYVVPVTPTNLCDIAQNIFCLQIETY